MLTGPPLPLPPEFPLRQLIPLIAQLEQVGAWVTGSGGCHRLTITAGGRCAAMVIGEDLGELLRSCTQVVVRGGSGPEAIAVETLIQSRALKVGCGLALLPSPERLKEAFPEVQVEVGGFVVPIDARSPEEVLARCVSQGIPVMESAVVYKW